MRGRVFKRETCSDKSSASRPRRQVLVSQDERQGAMIQDVERDTECAHLVRSDQVDIG